MNGRWPRWPVWLVALHVTFVTALVWLACVWCVANEAQNAPCLGTFAPIVDSIVTLGRRLVPYTLPRQLILPGSAALIVAYLLFRRTAPSKPSTDPALPEGNRTSLPYAEAVGLALFTCVVVLYRFYLLNRLPSDSVAEVHFVYLASSDWQSMFQNNANEGAPLGLIHYLMAGELWRCFGATMLTPRFATAITSVFVAQAIYGWGRMLGGPMTAFLAAAFYTFSPVEMAWSRHDMFPFANPSLLIVPLAAVTYLAVTRNHVRDWTATALLMGASRHLFASGLSAFMAPVGTVLWIWLFDRARAVRFRWKPVLLLGGIGLWVVGRSVAKFLGNGTWQWYSPYTAGLSSRGLTRDGGGLAPFRILGFNIEEIFRGLFLGGFDLDHQTPMGSFAPLPWIPPLVAILFAVGLVWCIVNRRDVRASVLVPLLGATTLPALMSIPDAHRMAAAFPMICLLAALSLMSSLRWIRNRWPPGGAVVSFGLPLAIVVTMGSMAGARYFRQTPGEPPPSTLAREIRSFLAPDTLLVLDLPDSLAVEEHFLLFDDMLRDRIAIVVPGRHGRNAWPEVASDPQVLLRDVFYSETGLRHRVPELEDAEWNRIVFILHEALDRESKLRLLEDIYQDTSVTIVSTPTWRPGYDFTAVEVRRDSRAALVE